MPLLKIQNLTKIYKGEVRANDDISLQVDAGEVFGLLGHNGAGKTTMLNQIVGIARPTSGGITINGLDAVADPQKAREVCSFQPQSQAPLGGLTPRQAIEMMARIRGASRTHARARAKELLRRLDLDEWADKLSDKLSGGVKRLTAFCMTAAQPGDLVMFDEPTNDVDPVRRRLLWKEIRALAEEGRAVLLVTHNVAEAERAVERLAILDQGKVIAQGTPAQLRGEQEGRLRLELTAPDPAAAARVAEAYTDVAVIGRRVIVSVAPDAAIDAIAKVQQEKDIEEFSVTPVSLEDIYIRLVGTEDSDATMAA